MCVCMCVCVCGGGGGGGGVRYAGGEFFLHFLKKPHHYR